jgi:hypothetical protein
VFTSAPHQTPRQISARQPSVRHHCCALPFLSVTQRSVVCFISTLASIVSPAATVCHHHPDRSETSLLRLALLICHPTQCRLLHHCPHKYSFTHRHRVSSQVKSGHPLQCNAEFVFVCCNLSTLAATLNPLSLVTHCQHHWSRHMMFKYRHSTLPTTHSLLLQTRRQRLLCFRVLLLGLVAAAN